MYTAMSKSHGNYKPKISNTHTYKEEKGIQVTRKKKEQRGKPNQKQLTKWQ